jgi:hypothetical protein
VALESSLDTVSILFAIYQQQQLSLMTEQIPFHETEITHGFDDKGRQFDLVGNMKQWWNNATIRNFRERAQCIIDQYSRYRIDEVGLFMNGRMTQGENIAVRESECI